MENELKFNKYSSIENTYQTLYLNKVRQIVPKDAIWDVTEKSMEQIVALLQW